MYKQHIHPAKRIVNDVLMKFQRFASLHSSDCEDCGELHFEANIKMTISNFAMKEIVIKRDVVLVHVCERTCNVMDVDVWEIGLFGIGYRWTIGEEAGSLGEPGFFRLRSYQVK